MMSNKMMMDDNGADDDSNAMVFVEHVLCSRHYAKCFIYMYNKYMHMYIYIWSLT